MKLSLCAIVKNEETTLPRCLNSVKAVVDEMVVLDTGSTDRTPDMAREFGAIVREFPWCDDFAAARNAALQQVTGDWVLVLDADEVLVSDIVPQLKGAIADADRLLVNLIRQEVGASQSPYSRVSRLFRHHPAISFSRPYHAMVDDSVQTLLQREPHWQVTQLESVAILHDGYQPDSIAAKDKFDRAKTAMEGYLATHPNDAYVCSKLGALYVQGGDLDIGMALLKRGLHHATDAPVLYELHYHLGIACNRQQQGDRAKTHYQEAIQIELAPQLKLGAYNNLGNLLKEEGNLTQAAQTYQRVLQIDPNLAVAHYNWGLTLKAMGRLKEAIAAYRQAIQLNPNYAEAYQNLGVVLLKTGNAMDSLAAFKTAIALYEQHQSPVAGQLRQGLKNLGFNAGGAT